MDKLIYIARSRIPSARANCVQTLKMCAGFAAHAPVELIAPYFREDAIERDTLHERFALAREFPVAWVRFPHWGERFAVRGYALAATLRARTSGAKFVYTREPWSAYWLAQAGMRVGFEAHYLDEDQRYPVWQRLVRADGLPGLKGIFCISKRLIEDYAAAGARRDLLRWAPDGVDLQRFEPALSKSAARARLNLPADARIVCHSGHLYPGRGVEETVDALAELPGVLLDLVGGDPADIERVRAHAASRGIADRVRFEGTVPNAEVAVYLQAADALVMPYTSRTPTVRAMSPLKMFEYMAAGRPIVATDFPAVREILRGGENAVIVRPDSAAEIGAGLRRVLADPVLAKGLAAQARSDVNAYTWERRAKTILDVLERA